MKKLSFFLLGGCCDFNKVCIEIGKKDMELKRCQDMLNFKSVEALIVFIAFAASVFGCAYLAKACHDGIGSPDDDGACAVGAGFFVIGGFVLLGFTISSFLKLYKVVFTTYLLF